MLPPGLLTAAFLFVPLTVVSVAELSSAYEPDGAVWALALGVAVAGHVAIGAAVGIRLRRLG